MTLPKSADAIFIEASKTQSGKIRSLNLKQLYDEGVNTDGVLIGHYSNVTVYLKSIAANYGRDSKSDHITLRDTGDFYATFKVVFLKNSFTIQANDNKDGDHLQEIYPKILGLTDESKAELSQLIKPNIVKAIRAKILQ